MRGRADDGKCQYASGNLRRDVRWVENDASALPLPMESGGSGRRGARALNEAEDSLSAYGSNDGGTRCLSTSAAERRVIAE